MFTRKVILLSFLCLTLFAVAQSPDSLLRELKKASTDTGRIRQLNQLTDLYIGDKNDSAKYFNHQALEISTKKHLEKYSFDVHYFKAQLEKLDGKFDRAHATLLFASRIARLNGNDTQEAKTLRLAGSIYDAQNLEKEAIESYLKALQMCTVNKNKKGILASNVALGLYFKKHNEATNGLKYFLAANKLAEEMRDSSNLFTCIINLGTLYEVTNDKIKALNLYRKALLINENDNDDNGKAISTFKIGRLYYALGKKDSARYFLNQTLALHLKNKQERGLIFDYAYLGTTYEEEGDLQKAYENWNMALMLGRKYSDSGRVHMVYSYMAAAEQKREKFQKALELYRLSVDWAPMTISNETMVVLYKKMATASEKLGQYKQAYEYMCLCKIFSDSSRNVSEIKKQTEMKMSYEFDEVQKKLMAEAEAKEKENLEKHEKQRQQRNLLITGLVIISLFFGLAVRSYRMKRKANTLLELQKQEIERQRKIMEEKNDEILDSIRYAKKIQQSLLPTEKYISKFLKRR